MSDDTKKPREFWVKDSNYKEGMDEHFYAYDYPQEREGDWIHVREVIEGEPEYPYLSKIKATAGSLPEAISEFRIKFEAENERDKYKSLCEELAAGIESDHECYSDCECDMCSALAKYKAAVKGEVK